MPLATRTLPTGTAASADPPPPVGVTDGSAGGASAPAAARAVRWYNFAAYGANDILGAGSMAVISGWVLIFYTPSGGLEPWQAGAIFAVARLLDAIASPVIGHISDNFG